MNGESAEFEHKTAFILDICLTYKFSQGHCLVKNSQSWIWGDFPISYYLKELWDYKNTPGELQFLFQRIV